ncbi:MAG: fibronectin type III domain-containing protein [Oscillospiraceae bacterium]|nr:fibronectin type III domain-containing protein [Oscillospiraceae bacterium]
MNNKKLLSGAMAGIMAVTSSVVSVSPEAFAADGASQTVINSQSVDGWNPLGVDLRLFGIMNDSTTVTISCTTAETNITDDKGNTPEAAFGVVINNNWDKATMPRCAYDPSKTYFEMTLTSAELDNNPVFVIQSQINVAATFTVTASGLDADDREVISLPSLSRDVTLYAYEDSTWLYGSLCGGSAAIPEDQISGSYSIVYGTTTIGDLRANVKEFSSPANTYFSDSLGVGADAFSYNIEIEYRDVYGDTQTAGSADSFDFESAGTTYIDNIFADDSLDDCTVTGINLTVGSKCGWDDNLGSNVAANKRISEMIPGSVCLLETASDSRKDLTLDPVTEGSVDISVYTWGDGTLFGDGFISLDPGELQGITFSDFIANYHSVSVAAPGYFSNNAGIGESDLVYNINIGFQNDDFSDSRWLDLDLSLLKNGTTLCTSCYEDLLNGAEDFTLTDIGIRVTPRMENARVYNSDTDEYDYVYRARSEEFRALKSGSSFTVEFVEDTRAAVVVPVTDYSVTMDVWEDPNWLVGSNATGSTGGLTVKGITYGTTTFEQLRQSAKSLSATATYLSDSLTAGQEAFQYRFVFRFADDSELYCDTCADLGDTLTQYLDRIDITGYENTVISTVYLNIKAKLENAGNDMQRTVSEVIRAQEPGTSFTIEFKNDHRTAVESDAPTAPVRLNVWESTEEDSWMVGNDFGAGTAALVIPEVTYGTTTVGELCTDVRSITTTLPYYFDSVGAGKDAFTYKYVIVSEYNWYYGETAVPVGETLTIYTDDILEMVGDSSAVISEISLNIEPAREFINEDQQQAVSEVIRSLPADTTFLYEPVKDAREDLTLGLTYPLSVELETFGEDEWYSGTTAFVQLYSEADKLSGITVAEMLSKIHLISVAAPGYISDSLNIGKEYFDYQIGISITDGNCEDHLFSGKQPLDKDNILYTSALWYEGRESMTIDRVYVKIWAATEVTEDGREQSKSEVIRDLTPGETFTVQLREENIKPQNVKATAGDKQVTLSWDEVNGATNYTVLVKDGTSWKSLGATGTKTTYTATGLTNGTAYTFAVRAYANGKWSEMSDSVSATPKAPAASAPTNVKASAGDSKVTLT